MKKDKLMVSILTACIFLSVSALSIARAGDVIELKATSWLPTQHLMAQEVYIPWGKMIEKRTNGRVKFTWYLGGSLVKAEQGLNAVKDGTVDIVAPLAIWAFGKQFPATSAIFLPFQLDSETHASQSFYEAYQQIEGIRREFKGMKILAFQSSGMANFHMKDFLIKDIPDFKGKHIWPGNSIGAEALKLWGANPTFVKAADIYMSLQRGALAGVIVPTPVMADFRVTDFLNNHTLCAFFLGAQAVVINRAKWDSLPPDVQKVFEELTLPFSIAIGNKYGDMNDHIVAELKKRGDNIYVLPQAKKDEWRASVQSIFDNQIAEMNNAGLNGKAVLEKIQSTIEEARQKPYQLDQDWRVFKK